MSNIKDTLYMKFDKNTEVTHPKIVLGDVGSFVCKNQMVISHVKSMQLIHASEENGKRFVFSIMKIIEMVQKEFPNLDIQNIGETDFIVTYENQKRENKIRHWFKVFAILAITFCGAAFSIMAFNNDVSTTKLFAQIYQLLSGNKSDGYTVLEVTYSIGIAVGILVFFNHFFGWKMTADPTPMEIEMRTYEEDIQKTLMESYGRKGQKIDADSSD